MFRRNDNLIPVMSAGMVGLAIGALTAGPYADRLGRKKIMLFAVTGFSARINGPITRSCTAAITRRA